MTAEPQKPKFEPPPWEREAFDRFQKDRDASAAREALEAELQIVRNAGEPVNELQPASTEENRVEAGDQLAGKDEAPRIPQARIDSMLIQLRGEEPPAAKTNLPLVNGVTAFLGITGTFIVIQSAVLFGDARVSGSANMMLAALVSFMVLVTGLGFLAFAVMLFRKYHQ